MGSSGNDDNTHDFHAALTHAFSERYSVSVKDSFVIGQEPDFLRAGNTFTTFQRYHGKQHAQLRARLIFRPSSRRSSRWTVGYANTMLSYSDNANLVPQGRPTQQQWSVG